MARRVGQPFSKRKVSMGRDRSHMIINRGSPVEIVFAAGPPGPDTTEALANFIDAPDYSLIFENGLI